MTSIQKHPLPHGIEVPDPKELERKIEAMRAAGKDALHVLSDFDRTLTTTLVKSLIAVLRDDNLLGTEYSHEANRLYDTYHARGHDESLPLAERKRLMHRWWTEHFALLLRSGFKREHIEQVIDSGLVGLRPGVEEFLAILHEHGIPLVIMSASGLGTDAIALFLARYGLRYDNIHLVGNSFIWDEQGVAVGMHAPIVHDLNKDETTLSQFSFFNAIKDRHFVVQLGDSISDTGMVQGFSAAEVLSIGFLNEKVIERLPTFRQVFDMVLTNDAPMDEVNKVVRRIVEVTYET